MRLRIRFLNLVAIGLSLQIGIAFAQESTPQMGTLTKDTVDQLGYGGARFDLALMRAVPSLLDQKPIMQYFIALNNCHNREVGRALQNELDYPKLAAYYQPRAQEILNALQQYVKIAAPVEENPAQNTGWEIWNDQLLLEEYNTTKHAFPMAFHHVRGGKVTKGAELTGILAVEGTTDFRQGCPVADDTLRYNRAHRFLPSVYRVTFTPVTYAELPMTEATARGYIERTNADWRVVTLYLDIHLLDRPPRRTVANNQIEEAEFSGELSRVTVVVKHTGEPLGILLDDRSLPPPQTAPKPSPGPQAPSAAVTDQQLGAEISVVAWVVVAVETCGWKLPPDQDANVRRFTAAIDASSKYNPKAVLHSDMAQDRAKIAQVGQLDFCQSPLIRQKFDERSATLWPKGTVAAPPAQ